MARVHRDNYSSSSASTQIIRYTDMYAGLRVFALPRRLGRSRPDVFPWRAPNFPESVKTKTKMTTTTLKAWRGRRVHVYTICLGRKVKTRSKESAGWLEIASGLARDNYNMYVCLYECAYIYIICIYIHRGIEPRKGYKGHAAAAVAIYCRHFKLCDASGGGCAIRIENAGGRIICPKRIRLMCAV